MEGSPMPQRCPRCGPPCPLGHDVVSTTGLLSADAAQRLPAPGEHLPLLSNASAILPSELYAHRTWRQGDAGANEEHRTECRRDWAGQTATESCNAGLGNSGSPAAIACTSSLPGNPREGGQDNYPNSRGAWRHGARPFVQRAVSLHRPAHAYSQCARPVPETP